MSFINESDHKSDVSMHTVKSENDSRPSYLEIPQENSTLFDTDIPTPTCDRSFLIDVNKTLVDNLIKRAESFEIGREQYYKLQTERDQLKNSSDFYKTENEARLAEVNILSEQLKNTYNEASDIIKQTQSDANILRHQSENLVSQHKNMLADKQKEIEDKNLLINRLQSQLENLKIQNVHHRQVEPNSTSQNFDLIHQLEISLDETLRLKRFSGSNSENVEAWLSHVKKISRAKKWSDDKIFERVGHVLGGKALSIYEKCENSNITDMRIFAKRLRAEFAPANAESYFLSKLLDMSQGIDESIPDYNHKFEKIVSDFIRASEITPSESMLINIYRKSLQKTYQFKILEASPAPNTLQSAYDITRKYHDIRETIMPKTSPFKKHNQHHHPTRNNYSVHNISHARKQNFDNTHAHHSSVDFHTNKSINNQQNLHPKDRNARIHTHRSFNHNSTQNHLNKNFESRGDMHCVNCDYTNHNTKNCFRPPTRCERCHRLNHLTKYCFATTDKNNSPLPKVWKPKFDQNKPNFENNQSQGINTQQNFVKNQSKNQA